MESSYSFAVTQRTYEPLPADSSLECWINLLSRPLRTAVGGTRATGAVEHGGTESNKKRLRCAIGITASIVGWNNSIYPKRSILGNVNFAAEKSPEAFDATGDAPDDSGTDARPFNMSADPDIGFSTPKPLECAKSAPRAIELASFARVSGPVKIES